MKKNELSLILAAAIGLALTHNNTAQTVNSPNPQPPPPIARPTPNLSTVLSKNIETAQKIEIPRERREQAYAKLLEAQRYLWGMSRVRSQAGVTTGTRFAKQALQKAVELDPTLSEAYTALAEISLTSSPNDIEEAIMLANIAAKLNPNNFGARRILARVYTIKSRLNSGGALDSAAARKAVAEWKEVTRMDARNAEAWAFLSEFYDKSNRNEERIDALKKWMSSATPLETRFYRIIMGADQNLSPESATIKLGSALVKAGRGGEAIGILSRSVADNPENAEAIELLRQAVVNGDGQSSAAALESLQQAVFASPNNPVLVELLAEIQSRSGKTDDAVKTIQSSIVNLGGTDKNAIANLQVSLGDIYSQSNRNTEAVSAYEAALKTYGIEAALLTNDDEREFAAKVFEKMIAAYKNAGRTNDVRATIARARVLLGKDDLFSDKQTINLLRESGKKNEALQKIRLVRREFPEDYSLMRLEASILTEMGKVDAGVALIKTLMSDKKSAASPYYDDFSNYIFISGLYSQAKRPKEAILTAQQAFGTTQDAERKQIANLSLANAQHQSGDFKSAETTLRNILKQMPGNPFALNNLGYFLLEQNEKIDEAHQLIAQAVKIDPTNSTYLDSLGWANFKLGNLTASERYLKDSIRYNPISPVVYEHLGDVYEKQGKSELAKTAWQKALNLSKDSIAAQRIKTKIAKK